MHKPSQERRSPDRPHVMQRLLRRLAIVCLVLAAAILAVPRALLHLAVIGPTTTDQLATAHKAVAVARSYGATADLPAMAAAEREMASADALEGRAEHHEARHAAARALLLAADAQQGAIVRKDSQRIQAKQVIERLDHAVDELEELYNQRSKGLQRDRQKAIFSDMKRARAAAAALVLAWEQDDYRTVLQGESQAKAVIAAVKQQILAA